MGKFNAGLFLANLLSFGFYAPINIAREPLYVLNTSFDNFIPLIPFFTIPYLSFYFFIIFTLLYLFFKKHTMQLNLTLMSALLTIGVSYFTYIFFQTHIIRPVITNSDFFLNLLSLIYFIDQPYNGFPSLHTSLSIIGTITWFNIKSKYSKWCIIWAITIIASTVLIKQHYIVDIFGGLALGIFCYFIAGKLQRLNSYFGVRF